MNDTRVLPVRKKRRSRPSLSARLRTYWIFGTLAFAVAICGTVAAVRWSGFHPGDVAVAGASHVEAAAIRRAAGVDPHANIWLTDTRAMERRIEAIPYVRTAAVRRVLPARVSIEIVEREPDACVRFAGRPGDELTIDATRRVLAAGCDDAPDFAYAIGGEPLAPGRTLDRSDLETLQADRAALAAVGRSFASLSFDRFGGLDARLPDGIAVRFGDDLELDEKAQLIGPVLAAVASRIGFVAAVDVRAPSAPVVDFRP